MAKTFKGHQTEITFTSIMFMLDTFDDADSRIRDFLQETGSATTSAQRHFIYDFLTNMEADLEGCRKALEESFKG